MEITCSSKGYYSKIKPEVGGRAEFDFGRVACGVFCNIHLVLDR